MASSQSFSRIQRRISLSPLPASPVNRGEPFMTMATREPPSSAVLHAAEHVLQEEELAVADARQAGAEAPGVAPLALSASTASWSVFQSLP